jgi:holliday junction DNA helicase RuvA
MISLLRGTVVDGAVLTSCGVGYQVLTVEPLVEGGEVLLRIHHAQSETGSVLYGFPDRDQQLVFEALVRINGVAGRTALALLRDVGTARIYAAVVSGDARALTAARGVGPKLAATIVATVSLPEGIAAAEAGDPRLAELVETLSALGWPSARATTAAEHVLAEAAADAPVEQLLRAALQRAA